MNDEEIVALIAGGHTLGKAHGAKSPKNCIGAEPAAAAIEEQGFGWTNKCGKGNAEDTITSGLEGAWSSTPASWSVLFLDNLFRFEWEKTQSPAGATQWIPTDKAAAALVPDAHDSLKRHAPIMFTTDIALKEDPGFRKIAKRFLKDPKAFDLAFAKAWYKLTHRDMGPLARYVGAEVPDEVLPWQDHVPAVNHKLIDTEEIAKLKKKLLDSGLSSAELIRTAWASAASYRGTDMRGGANGSRVRLAPQKDWVVNNPEELGKALKTLEDVQKSFNKSLSGGKKVSLADVIVVAGAAAVEQAAKKAGYAVKVPFVPGRTDATQKQTNVKSFAVLEPQADGFRNYFGEDSYYAPAKALVDRANLLTLTVPEMTALVGGMRVLDANTAGSKHGVLTKKTGTLSNDFFVNLLDMSTKWSKSTKSTGIYEGHNRDTGKLQWTATTVDLIFGSNSELRAIAEVYAADDGEEKFVKDFVAPGIK